MKHLLAAVDLGSNSFRLSIGQAVQKAEGIQIYQIDRFRETVRLAAGLDNNDHLSDAAIARAIDALKRFSIKLRHYHPHQVRAVATNTFRVARNIAEFLPQAEAALGFPIEVIAGQEEARLIFSGVVHTLPPAAHKRLVIDIGGGSTELIIGEGTEPLLMSSLYMGCVSYSQRFFPEGKVDAFLLRQAELAAQREIEGILQSYQQMGWQEVYGSSGTVKALSFALAGSDIEKQGITRANLMRLKKQAIQAGCITPEVVRGIKQERAEVLPGGLAIMCALFDALNIDTLFPAEGALHLGVLYDLLRRDDKRDESVRQFMQRYHVDRAQAARVRRVAQTLFEGMGLKEEERALFQTLGWAADLHEIGVSIAHTSHHKHAFYILAHADMLGFSRADQRLLGALVLGQSGKLRKLVNLVCSRAQWLAILCLRLAIMLCRRREAIQDLPLKVTACATIIVVWVQPNWLAAHPVSDFILRSEESTWRRMGFSFMVQDWVL